MTAIPCRSLPDPCLSFTKRFHNHGEGFSRVIFGNLQLKLYAQVCEDQGNLNNERYGDPALNPYTQYDTARLRYSVRDTTCGLTITRPHANDTGTWKCSVTDNSPEGTPVTLFK